MRCETARSKRCSTLSRRPRSASTPFAAGADRRRSSSQRCYADSRPHSDPLRGRPERVESIVRGAERFVLYRGLLPRHRSTQTESMSVTALQHVEAFARSRVSFAATALRLGLGAVFLAHS